MNDEERPQRDDNTPAEPKRPRKRGGSSRDRSWTIDDPETTERSDWALSEARKRVKTEPWAAVVLAQVAVEVELAWVVHVLTQFQEPALRRWIEHLKIETLAHEDELGLINALLADTGESIEGDKSVWDKYREHVKRRNAFVHRGERPTVEQAHASLTASTSFVERLMRLAAQQTRILNEKREAELERSPYHEFVKREMGQRDPAPDEDTKLGR